MPVLHGEGSAVRAGDTVAVYERNGERTINAFLTHDVAKWKSYDAPFQA